MSLNICNIRPIYIKNLIHIVDCDWTVKNMLIAEEMLKYLLQWTTKLAREGSCMVDSLELSAGILVLLASNSLYQ